MDPRLHDRRVAVLREQGRRRLRRLALVATVLAIIAAGVGVVFSPLLDVDRIVVRGTEGPRAAEVLRSIGVERGDPLALVDTGGAAEQVEALPWVDHARVARHFPGSLTVIVTPRVPVAWATAPDGSVQLIDRRAVVLATSAVVPPGLPQLAVQEAATPAATGHLLAQAARVAAGLTPALRASVMVVAITDGQAVLTLSTGTQVRLGAPVDVAAKSRAAVAVLTSLGGVAPGYLDVRVPSAPVTG